VLKYEMGKARGLRWQDSRRGPSTGEQNSGKARGRLVPSKACNASRQLGEFTHLARRRRRNGVVDHGSTCEARLVT
jgi:hypothetical protein